MYFVFESLSLNVFCILGYLAKVIDKSNFKMCFVICNLNAFRKYFKQHRGRGRPRQKLVNWMMEDGYGKLKEKAEHRKEWSQWTSGRAGSQMTCRRRRRRMLSNLYYTMYV